jgi:hypothetical protein
MAFRFKPGELQVPAVGAFALQTCATALEAPGTVPAAGTAIFLDLARRCSRARIDRGRYDL